MEHTALETDLILTLVIRFIFWKELNTQHHHLCSSNQSSEDVKATSQKSISALLQQNTAYARATS